jgi:peptide/nickel transport system substrate-binding protein
VSFSRKGAVLVASAAVGAIVLSACAGNTASSQKKSNQLIYGADQFPANWQPDISAGNLTATANGIVRILPSAFYTNPKFKYQADSELLSETPKVTSQNPFTVQYKINPKAVWSDGKPINADDFIFNWKVNNPDDTTYGGSGSKLGDNACQTIAGNYNLIKSVTGSDGGHTVTMVYSTPFPDYQSLFSTLLPAHLFMQSSPAATCKAFNTGWPANKPLPISGGPWKMSAVDKTNQTFTLTPNDKYWGTKPKLSKLIYKTVGTDSTSLAQDMQNNETQMIYPQPQLDLISLLKKVPNITTTTSLGLSFEHIDFNVENPYLKDKAVRQAIALAIDRNALVARTAGQFDNRIKPLNNRIFVNNQPGYQDNAPPQYNSRNVAKAKQLLEGAGYKYQGSSLTKNGKAVSLTMGTTTNNALRKDTEVFVQSQLKAIGINLQPKQVDADTFFGDYKTQGATAAGDWDLNLFAWVATPALSQNKSIYACAPHNSRAQEQQNYTLGCDPAVDKLMNKAVVTTDPSAAIALWNQVDKLLWGDMFTLPLYQKPTVISYSNNYSGISDNASSQGPLWNSETWSVK